MELNDKRGTVYFSLIIALIIFMVGMIAVNFVKGEVTNARVGLECSNAAGITDGTKLLCLITDSAVPYFILLILSISLGVITEKLLI